MAQKTSVGGREELLVFDTEDLINGIGGALGLFLGWSLLYLVTECYGFMSHVCLVSGGVDIVKSH